MELAQRDTHPVEAWKVEGWQMADGNEMENDGNSGGTAAFSLKFLQTLINLSPDILYVYDLIERKNIYSNDGVQKILGYSAGELKVMGSQIIPILMHPEDFETYNEVILPKYALLKDGELIVHQYRMKHKDQTWRFLESNELIYARQPDNSPAQIFGVIHDITKARLAEEELRKKDIQFRKLSENVPDLIFQFTRRPDGTYCVPIASEGIRNIFGCTPEDVIDDFSPIGKVLHPEDAARVIKDIEYSAEHLTYFTCEFRVQIPGKPVQWIFSRSAPEKQPDGSITWYGFNADITGRKTAEVERDKLKDQLNQMQKLESLGILAGGIAHDFNNLMGGIFGYIDLANGCSGDPDVSDYLEKALATINRARSLTQQLLTFSKGGAPIQKVGSLFPCVTDAVQFALSGSHISCHFEVPENIHPCNFDKNQISQVIDNIVINAQHAMPTGGTIELLVKNVELEEDNHLKLSKGPYVQMSIRDHGIGIPKDFLPRIFDPFFTTKSKGHGLGLATCYSIINRHSGAIDVESEQGKGSTFHIYLPAAGKTASGDAAPPVVNHIGSGIFIVMDDEEVMRDTIGNMLAALGYTIECTVNGEDTLKLLSEIGSVKRPVAGLILDLTIPGGMGGTETIAEIRKMDSKIPVFVASGYADDPVMQNPSDYGFTASISKPFMKDELSEMLSRYI